MIAISSKKASLAELHQLKDMLLRSADAGGRGFGMLGDGEEHEGVAGKHSANSAEVTELTRRSVNPSYS